MTELYSAVLKRFLRVFAVGAVGQALAVTATTQSVTDWQSFQAWLYMLLTAAIIGGLAALDKALRWQDEA